MRSAYFDSPSICKALCLSSTETLYNFTAALFRAVSLRFFSQTDLNYLQYTQFAGKNTKKKRIAHKCNKSNLFEQITTCVVLKLQFFVLSTSQVDELITNSHKYTSNYRMVTLEKKL